MTTAHGGDIYASGQPDSILDFSVNTNPLGPPEAVVSAMADTAPDAGRYPDLHHRRLIAALAEHHGVPPAWLLPGAGAADLIYRFVFALRPRRVLIPAPTFSEYEKAARAADSAPVFELLTHRAGFPVEADIVGRMTPSIRALFLCNPNNPTGALAGPGAVEAAAEHCAAQGARLFLDECFIDFVDGVPTALPLLEKYPNLVILRAMTKNYAMPGARLGYALSADTELLDAMRRSGPPWQVSCFAEAGALAALGCDGFLERTRALLRTERPTLCRALEGLGLRVVGNPSANYILFRANTCMLKERLLDADILIRQCGDYRGLSDYYYRVAVRTPADNARLLRALTDVLRPPRRH